MWRENCCVIQNSKRRKRENHLKVFFSSKGVHIYAKQLDILTQMYMGLHNQRTMNKRRSALSKRWWILYPCVIIPAIKMYIQLCSLSYTHFKYDTFPSSRVSCQKWTLKSTFGFNFKMSANFSDIVADVGHAKFFGNADSSTVIILIVKILCLV